MTVFLIGMMGAGKTTLGKALAAALSAHFLDSDEEIVRTSGRSIAEWFDVEGEEAFRQYEATWLETLPSKPMQVVATGGGMPIYNGNMKKMLRRGKVIYLEASVDLLCQRLRSNIEHRPLLQDKDEITLQQWVHDMLEHRAPIYQQAHETVSATDLLDNMLIGQMALRLRAEREAGLDGGPIGSK